MGAYYGHHKTNNNVKDDCGDLSGIVPMRELQVRTEGVQLTSIRRG